jgi:hypothetical protein
MRRNTCTEKHHPQILRHQREAEDVETAAFHVEEKRRISIHRDPRQRDIERHQKPADQLPAKRPTATHIRGMQKYPGAVTTDRRDGIQIGRPAFLETLQHAG